MRCKGAVAQKSIRTQKWTGPNRERESVDPTTAGHWSQNNILHERGKKNMFCPECLHDEHEPAQCDHCNCGESEILHSTSYRELTIVPARSLNEDSSFMWYGYDFGHRVPKRRE